MVAPELDEQSRSQQRREEKRRKSAEKEVKRVQRAENQELAELDRLEEIEAKGWKALRDDSWGDLTDATLLPLQHCILYSAPDFLCLILGTWLDVELRPYIDLGLKRCRKHANRDSARHYHPLRDGELLKYILSRCIEALQKHRAHSTALSNLMSKHRRSALSARFAVDPAELSAILSSWTTHVCTFIQIGAVSAVDEAIFPHFGKNANDARHLQHIPGKPHDFGLIGYIFAQRLQHTDAPIALALSINHVHRSLTPTDCAIELHSAVTAAAANQIAVPYLVADSLWSAPATLKEFDLRHIRYCVALKSGRGARVRDATTQSTYTKRRATLLCLRHRHPERGELKCRPL